MSDENAKREKHAGGRPATGVKRVTVCISGQPEQIEALKSAAAAAGQTISGYVLQKTGVINYEQ